MARGLSSPTLPRIAELSMRRERLRRDVLAHKARLEIASVMCDYAEAKGNTEAIVDQACEYYFDASQALRRANMLIKRLSIVIQYRFWCWQQANIIPKEA